MKTSALLCAGLVLFGACREETKQAGEPAERLFESRLKEEGRLTFAAWNGNSTDYGHTCYVWFGPDSQIVVNAMGYGVEIYTGSFRLPGHGLVEAKLREDSGIEDADWPRMLLRREGEDLLLYREDGMTSWHKPDWPYPAKDLGGFWPFRALKNTTAKQGRGP